MGEPRPRTAVERGNSVEARLAEFERRLGVLPGRLRRDGAQVLDWNDATLAGFYWANAFALNAPVEDLQFVGEVLVHGQSGMVSQVAYQVNLTDAERIGVAYRRFRTGAEVWTPWVEMTGGGGGEVPLATELTAGIAQLADEWEAMLYPFDPFDPEGGPTPNLVSTIMTPQRVKQLVDYFTPVAGQGRNSMNIEDWNDATDVGFYWGYRSQFGGTLNSPPNNATYFGLVHNASSSGYASGGQGYVLQELIELDDTFEAERVAGRWLRFGSPDYPVVWGPWVADDSLTSDDVLTLLRSSGAAATQTERGAIEIATNAEVIAGADGTRAVTPAGMRAAYNDWAMIAQKAIDATWAAYPMGYSVFFSNAQAGWPATYGTVQTIKGWSSGGGTLQIWTGYNTDYGKMLMRQWPYNGSAWTDWVEVTTPQASATVSGKVELATNAEAQAGTDATRAVTPAAMRADSTSTAAGNRVIRRDAGGRAQVSDPSAAADIATKAYVDSVAGGVPDGYLLRTIVRLPSSSTFAKGDFPWLRALRVRAVGGGGSGGGAGGASGGQNSYGTGGGSGAYAESFITDIAAIPTSVTVTVGAGGGATAAGAITGNAGGASSFGSLVVAGGGGGGLSKPNTALGGYLPGGSPGVATAGDVQQGGTPGSMGTGLNTLSQSGNGGSSVFGGGGYGPASGAGGGSSAGNPGAAWGAGGSGASVNAGGVAAASGAGASGVVILELYG